MKILYLHGLESKLSEEKRTILGRFGEVSAPNLNYYNNPDAIESIVEKYGKAGIDVVIGSSIGGFAAYYVSTVLKKPALLFNPALRKRSVEQIIPSEAINSYTLKHFVLGADDNVVNPADTMNFISEKYNEFTDFHLHIRPKLAHSIPVHVFEDEVENFFTQVLGKYIKQRH
ncbi:YqiA/YcfP family alpha/beta fold hydrolase [Gillisia sp. Q332]|uniref:YqiA/YcfP family alpha/beta fold hydrolase n=1 Tax=Gillisia xinjiangensis TaxID=3384765 RepID=UPI00391D8A38